MPALQPSASDVHVDAIMTNHSVAYIQQATDFIASTFAPRVPVQKQSDKYYIFTKGDWFRDEAKQRAGSSESVGAGYSLSTDSYFSEQFSIHKDVSRDVKANTDNPLDWRRNATQLVTQRLLLKREVEFAALRAEDPGIGRDRRQLVVVDEPRLVQQAPDQRALAIIHAAAGNETQQALLPGHQK